MRLIILLTILFGLHFPASAGESPLSLYGEKIEFNVVRDNKVVGKHTTKFVENAGQLIVSSDMTIDIEFLNINFFNFYYQSKEIWRDQQLVFLKVNVNDDGALQKISAHKKKNILHVQSKNRQYDITEKIYTTNHWAFDVTNQDKVLNTLTGNINNITVTKRGIEKITTVTGELMANRYDYSGELEDTSAWYDESGRWVKLMFKGRDGSKIEYVCSTCDEFPPS